MTHYSFSVNVVLKDLDVVLKISVYTLEIIHLELLDRPLETLPGQESAPAPELAVTYAAQAANDQSPGDQGQ